MPVPTTLAERLQAQRRVVGVTLSQVARYLGWDPGTLSRYLSGTWRMPPARAAMLEAFLSAEATELNRHKCLTDFLLKRVLDSIGTYLDSIGT
jgi:transcriptional regulator with XRE-family HTH domain